MFVLFVPEVNSFYGAFYDSFVISDYTEWNGRMIGNE
jgi:hypothetical protein